MDHNLSSLKAGLPPSSSTYSPHQDDTLSPDFILQQVVNGEYKRRMPSIVHSTMVTSTPNNDTTMPSHNTQGGGEPTSSAYQQQSGSTHGNGGQANPCDAVSGHEGGSNAGAGGSGGDGNRGQGRPPDQDDEDDTSHEQSAETTTSSSGGSSVPHLVPPVVAVQSFTANPNASIVCRHNGSSQHQDRQTSHEESLQSDNDSIGGASDATTAVVSDSDLRWRGVLPSSHPNHRSSSSAVTKSSSSSLNSSDTRTAAVSEALDVSSIVTISTLSSLTNTSSSSTDGKNILLSSTSKHKGNITHDSSGESLTLETRHVAHQSPPPSPPMSQSFQESDNFDLDATGASEEALSSTPVESSAPLQLSEPMLVLETLDDDCDGDIIPPSPEAYGSSCSRIIPGTPPEMVSTPEDSTLCRQRHEDSRVEEGTMDLKKAKETPRIAAKETSFEETECNLISKETQSDPPPEKLGASVPTKLSDEQLSRGVEISPVKISPLQDPVNRRVALPSAAVSRRIQFDSSTDESHENTPISETVVQLPPTKSCDKQHSSLAPPVPSSARLPTQIIRKLLDWPQEDTSKEYSATSSPGDDNCDIHKSSQHVETENILPVSDPNQSDRFQSSDDQALPQNTSQKLQHTKIAVEVSTAFTTPSCAIRDECTFIAPSLPVNSQQLHLEDNSSTDEYDDEEDDPKNTFTQVESQGGTLEPLVLSDLDESISPDAVLVSAFHDIPIRPLVNVTRDKKEVYKKIIPVPSKKKCSAETQLTMQNMQLHPPIVSESAKPISTTVKKMTDVPLSQQLIPEEDPFAMLRQPDLSFGEMMLGLPGPSGVKRDPPPQPHHSDTDSDASESNLPQEPPKLSIRELLKSHELHSMIPLCGSVKGKGRGKRSKMNAVDSTISLEESLRQEFTSIPQLLPPAYDPMQRPSPKPPDKLLHSELMSNQVFVSTDNEINIAIATELSLQEQHSLRRATQQVNRASVCPSDNLSLRSNENISAYSVNNSAVTITTTSTTTTTTPMSSTTTTTDAYNAKSQPKSEVRMRFSSVAKRKTRSRLSRQTTLRARAVKGRLKQVGMKEEHIMPSVTEPSVASACLEGKKSAIHGGCRNAKKRSASCVQRELTAARLPSTTMCVTAVAKRHSISKALQKVTRPRRFLSSKEKDKRKVICPEDANAALVPTEVRLSSEDSEVPNSKRTSSGTQEDASIKLHEGDTQEGVSLGSKRLRLEGRGKITKEIKTAEVSSDRLTHPIAQRVITTTVITKRVIVEEFLCQGKVVDKHCHQIEEEPVITRLVETVPSGCSPCTMEDVSKNPIFRTPSNASTSSSSLTKASSSGSLADISSMGSSSSGTSYPSQRIRNKNTLKQDESPESRLLKAASLGSRNSNATSTVEIDLDKRWEATRTTLHCSTDCTNSGSHSQTVSVQNESPQQAHVNVSEASSSLNLEAAHKQYSLRCKGQATRTETLKRKRLERRPSASEELDSIAQPVASSSRLPLGIRQLNENTPRSETRKHHTRVKQTADNSEKKRQRPTDKTTSEEDKSLLPAGAVSSQSNDPADEDSTSVVKIISEGLRVMARWQDGRYYPGEVISQDTKDRWVVKFDDGDAKPIPETKIVGIQRLPTGTSVYAKTETDEFDCGIVEAHFYQHSALNYVVDTDSGKKLVVPCSFIMMTSDQVSCLLDSSEANTEEGAAITLKNVVTGNRRSRSSLVSASNTESPAKRTPSTPKPILSPKQSTPKTPQSLRGQRRPQPVFRDLELAANAPHPSPKRRRQETASHATPGRKNQKSTPKRTPKQTPSSPAADVQKEITEQTTVQDPALGPIPPTSSTLFEGLIFVLTSAEKTSKPLNSPPEEGSLLSSTDTTVTEDEIPVSNPFSKSHLKLQIQTGGGIVLDEFDETVLASREKCFLVSNAHVRTSKFLRCLAVGIPCLSHVWIINSCCLGKLQDCKAYLLPAGVSIMTKRLVEWHGKTLILDGLEICVSGNTEFVTVWTSIVKSTGASVVSRLPVLSGGKNALVPDIHAVVADSTCPSSTIRRCSKLGIPVVNIEWVVQCLIHGKRLGLDDHPKFIFNSSSDS